VRAKESDGERERKGESVDGVRRGREKGRKEGSGASVPSMECERANESDGEGERRRERRLGEREGERGRDGVCVRERI
jgi:hypothetical protein